MARRTTISLLAALALLIAMPAYGAGTRASLTVSGKMVRGAHFRPGERVRVTITTAKTVVLRLRASAAGTFAVGVPSRDPCNDSLVIVAVGGAGDTARLKVMPRMCPPQP
jgi:hypothetical protein